MTLFWVVFLLVAGLALVLAEFLVPGGICGVAGAVLIVVSCIAGCYRYPDHITLVIFLEFVAVVGGILAGALVLPRTRAAKALVLADAQQADKGWVAAESDTTLLGAIGDVLTPLRPAGTVVVGGKRLGAVSNGELIEAGEKIRVTEVHGNRIVVEKAE